MIKESYSPEKFEKNIYENWYKNKLFISNVENNNLKKNSFCVLVPPPNITGNLHMGHGFQISIIDLYIRYKKMNGFDVLCQGGIDHAGIATQILIENKLKKDGLTKESIGRENFIKEVFNWKKKYGSAILEQKKRLGILIDWDDIRFTLDKPFNKTVNDIFVKLYEEGIVYKKKYLVNWDPSMKTAISDLEVTTKEENGFLYYIKYNIECSKDFIVVATTRPETIFGDTAVAINPSDERYKLLSGKNVKLPLTNRTIKIIEDNYVDLNFGTGCVKITPAHDNNDYEISKAHNLEMINIMNEDGTLNGLVPKKFIGIDRLDARKIVVDELINNNLLVKKEKYKIKIPICEKTGSVVEPFLTNQWFVDIKKLSNPAINAVKNNAISFIPKKWEKTYFNWMDNIKDWCISRQLWWGHRIPAWYDENDNMYVGINENSIRNKHKIPEDTKLFQDKDVLDTWFSSSLWPFVSLGWPKKTNKIQRYFPTNLLITAFDIIFFWVARMIMMSLKFTNEIPFQKVFITGLIRDSYGQKMSKSKGNVLDPIDLIDGIQLEELIKKRTSGLIKEGMKNSVIKTTKKEFPNGIESYGTDALRLTFCSIASVGKDINFDINRLKGYKNFCNKIWNVVKFVQINTEHLKDFEIDTFSETKINDNVVIINLWINSRINQTIRSVKNYFDTCRIDLLTNLLYDFVWKEYCDWYIELNKILLKENTIDDNSKVYLLKSLIKNTEIILKILHPIMPFITEELWCKFREFKFFKKLNPNNSKQFLVLEKFPTFCNKTIKKDIEFEFNVIKNIISNIRNIRDKFNIPTKKNLDIFVVVSESTYIVQKYEFFIKNLSKLNKINFINCKSEIDSKNIIKFNINDLLFIIFIESYVNKDVEISHIHSKINKIKCKLDYSIEKLKNKNFIKNAPTVIINKEKEKIISLQNEVDSLEESLNIIKNN